MRSLLSLAKNELKDIVAGLGAKPFAAGQLAQWLAKGVPFAEMTNLGRQLREKLADEYTEGYAQVIEKRVSKDGTEKYLLGVSGGDMVECVVMRYHHGSTLCVSTQVGCRMGCAFCASGKNGLVRNLTAGEMRSQLIAVQQGTEISNVVLMGSGEPLDNYNEVTAFIRALGQQHGIGMRHISLSTCGLVPQILRLSEEGLPVTLCLSLHSAIDDKRKIIMPVANVYPVRDIIAAADVYFKKTGRRIIIEYTLIRGFNDGTEDIDALANVLYGLNCHINVIPLNEAAGEYQPPSAAGAHEFAQVMQAKGKSASVRRSLGGDIEGACGQLKLKREGL